MKALVLAAGRGSRASDLTDSKPLLAVDGRPLIERTIASAVRAGADDIVVVLGHQRERVAPVLAQLAARHAVPVRGVHARDWPSGNGVSLLAAADCFGEPFLLLMSDHVVSDGILARLIKRGLAGDTCVLAVDHGVSPWVDPDDVTRVRLDGDRIVDIGKGLRDSEIYDTGVFLCAPGMFAAARAAWARGDGSVSGAVRELARTRLAGAVDVSGELWVDVDTARDAERARRALAASAAGGMLDRPAGPGG